MERRKLKLATIDDDDEEDEEEDDDDGEKDEEEDAIDCVENVHKADMRPHGQRRQVKTSNDLQTYSLNRNIGCKIMAARPALHIARGYNI